MKTIIARTRASQCAAHRVLRAQVEGEVLLKESGGYSQCVV
ncbi:MAG TPA: hypothetical protein VG345_13660 [Bryobacteraceae bacterium]|nr:hypothetical protein [Bryobacteraceae bacterium]